MPALIAGTAAAVSGINFRTSDIAQTIHPHSNAYEADAPQIGRRTLPLTGRRRAERDGYRTAGPLFGAAVERLVMPRS
jgi:hypothetical protein